MVYWIMDRNRSCILVMLVLLPSLLLCGCISGAWQREGTTDTSAGETVDASSADLASLSRELEILRGQIAEQEQRLTAMERALASGVLSGGTEVSDFTYELTDGGVRLTGWQGNASVLVIPQTIDGRPVTAIADGAFRDRAVETVIVPEGVQSVGWFAFSGCYRLSCVTLPASVTSIGYGAFDNCAAGLRFTVPSGSYAARYAISYGIPTSLS